MSRSELGQSVATDEQYDGPDVCETCEGYGEVCVGFGIWSEMRPGIAVCPDCGGTGQQRSGDD